MGTEKTSEQPQPNKARVVKKADRDGKRSGQRAAAPAEPAPARDPREVLAEMGWIDKWVSRGYEDPTQLLGNDLNWRAHPRYQQMAMQGVLETVGWLDTIKVNINTGRVFNGHMRCEISISKGLPYVPVDYYDLTEEEERIALATFDPLSSLALMGNRENYNALSNLPGVQNGVLGLRALVEHTAGRANIQAAFTTDFLSPFLNQDTKSAEPNSAGAVNAADTRAAASPGSTIAQQESAASGGLQGAPTEEADPGAPVTAEYHKVVFNFLIHQKRALFQLINQARAERGLSAETTQSEILLMLLGVPLTDENSQG